MFTLSDVQALLRDLSTTRVLSVYLETRVTDPAMRDAWRPALSTALRDLGASLPRNEHSEFERARDVLDDVLQRSGGVSGAHGWVAFVTASGERHTSGVPAPCPTVAAWRDGPVISPYMRALKEQRPVIVALVDSRSARLFRYAWGKLEQLPEKALSEDEHPAPGTVRGPGRRGQSLPAPRSATGTERARRRKAATFEALAAALAEDVASLAGDEAWILIGGTREWARLAGEALPTHLAGRATVSAALDHDATAAGIIEAAQQAATALRAAHGRALLDSLFEGARLSSRAAGGVPAVQRALRAQAVDLLVLSPAFVRGDAQAAEDAVRAALHQGADVEVLSGDAAERLDRTGGGIGARLRFTPA